MDKEFRFRKSITFGDILQMYQNIILVGFKPFNIYGLSANNYDLGIHLFSDPADKNDLTVSISEDNREQEILGVQKAVQKYVQAVEDSQSSDQLIANSSSVRAYQQFGRYDLEDIANEEVDHVLMFKQAKYIPVFGEKFDLQLPWVGNKDISIKKEEREYLIRLRADDRKELEITEQLIYELSWVGGPFPRALPTNLSRKSFK